MTQQGANAKKTCGGCSHFSPSPDLKVGECHRYPPTLVVMQNHVGQPAPASMYPPVQRALVCGEWVKRPLDEKTPFDIGLVQP